MKRNILLSLIFFIFIATNIFADEDGGRPGYFLNQGGGARALGMGRTYVAICDDASAVMWNPAGLYQLDQKEINTMYVSLFEDTHYGFISYAHPTTGVFSYGISALSLYSGDLIKRDINNNPIGTFYDMNNAVLIGLSYSKTPELSFGLNAKWINKIFDDINTSGFGLDVGMLFELCRNFLIGINLQNVIAAQIKREMLTDKTVFNIKGGISYKLFNKKLILGVDLDKTAKCDLKIHSGGEYSFPVRPYTIAVRGGYDQGNPSCGLGIKRGDYQIDYAMLYYTNELGISHKISFDVKFGLTTYEIQEKKKTKELSKIKAKRKELEKRILRHRNNAKRLHSVEKWRDAILEWEEVQKLDAGNQEAKNGIMLVKRDRISKYKNNSKKLQDRGKWEKAISELERVLVIDPNNKEVIDEIALLQKKKVEIKDRLSLIAVLDFKPQDVSASDARFVSEFFRQDLVRSDVFTVVERSNIEQVLAEQGFQQTGCTTEDCAIKVGKILNVGSTIIGDFGKFQDTYLLTIRQVDVETGKVIHADSETCYNAAELKIMTKSLADRLISKIK